MRLFLAGGVAGLIVGVGACFVYFSLKTLFTANARLDAKNAHPLPEGLKHPVSSDSKDPEETARGVGV